MPPSTSSPKGRRPAGRAQARPPGPRETRAREAQERAARLREEQARRARRNRLLVVGVLVAVVALVAVTVTVLLGQSGRSRLDGVAAPATANDAGGIVVGVDGPGEATADAPVVQVYSDFLCPFCRSFEETNGPMLEELRTAGEVTVVYQPVAFLDRLSAGTRYSTRAAQAAAVVADEAPEAFVEFWAALFAAQPAENTPGLTDAEIAGVARESGVPEDVVANFSAGRFTPWVDAASAQAARDLPRPATPTILLDGEVFGEDWRDPDVLRAAIVAAG